MIRVIHAHKFQKNFEALANISTLSDCLTERGRTSRMQAIKVVPQQAPNSDKFELVLTRVQILYLYPGRALINGVNFSGL